MEFHTNINRLKYFQAVCKHNNNITKAALELNISQPSVTVAIKDLEKELGVSLFNRTKSKHLLLTDDGKKVLTLSNKLLSDMENFFDVVKDIGARSSQKVRLGVPPILGTVLIPKMLSKLAQSTCQISLELFEYAAQDGIQALEENTVDLAILLLDNVPENYNYKVFFKTELQFCIGKEHPLSRNTYITCKDVEFTPLAILSSGSFHYAAIMKLFFHAHINPNILLRSYELTTITRLLEDFGVGTFTYKDIFQSNPNIVTIPCDIKGPVQICAVWRKEKHINQATKSFIHFLTSENWGEPIKD